MIVIDVTFTTPQLNVVFEAGVNTEGGSGDMASATYDPQGIGADAFDRANHTGQQPASTITTDAARRFVTDAEKNTWSGKQNDLGFTPEDASNKNQPNGYAGLDGAGLIPAGVLPSFLATVLAGLAAVAGTFTATDTVLSAFGHTKYFIDNIAATVRSTTLAGLNTTISQVIVAGDTVLSALGKLQAQLNAHTLSIADLDDTKADLEDVRFPQSGTATDFSSTVNPQGFSSVVVSFARYYTIGPNMRHIELQFTGTSTAGTCSFTMPFVLPRSQNIVVRVLNNGTGQFGLISIPANNTTATLFPTGNGGSFTGSGNKALANGNFTVHV